MAIQASGGKGGNVFGPALGSIDGDIAIFDGATGKKLKDTNNLIKHLNIAYGNLTLTPVPPPAACIASLAGLGAGNVDNGAHVYAITFVTAIGETELGTASNILTVVNQALDGQVSLTGIPIGPTGQGITQRKIYRTAAGGSTFYLLTTIVDNITVTYTDNTADAGLGVDDATFRSNDTQWIYVDGTKSGIITNYNISLGIDSGVSVTTGSGLTFLGTQSGNSNTTGYSNTFVGTESGFSNTSGNSNTFVGTQSGYSSDSINNTFAGYQSGFSNTTGSDNTFAGYQSGFSNINGVENVFVGYKSGYNNTTGSNNTYLGNQSGVSNIGGIENTFVGAYSGDKNTTGSDNTFIGTFCGFANTDGVENTFAGYQSGSANTSGNFNTFFGYNSGLTITLGTDCVAIGHAADTGSNSLVNSIAIGSGAIISNNDSWVIGKLGTKQNIFEGANAAMGTANLGAGGTIAVNNNLVTANSRIFLTIQVPGGGVGAVYVSARVPATSFTISSTNVADTSTVAWEIKDPA